MEPAKANRKLFWIGLLSLIIGSQIVALGSFVHNKLGLFTKVYMAPYPDANGNPIIWGDTSKVYGWVDQTVGIIGIVITLVAFVLIFIYMKQQGEEEKYREYLKDKKESEESEEKSEEDEEKEEEEELEPLLVQNKLFFWIGLGLLLFTGPLGVIFGFAAEDPSSTAGTAGIASGSMLTIIGFILIFLAIRKALFGKKEEPGAEEEQEDDEYEDEEEYEDEGDFDDEDEDLDEELPESDEDEEELDDEDEEEYEEDEDE